MAVPATPTNFFVQQGNGQVFLSWDLAAGATSYEVQRSTDGVTFTNLANPSPNNYLDTTVTLGTQYYYQVASVNASGTGVYSQPQNVVPTPTAEMSLGEIRNRSQQRADRLNSNFVTLPEWNFFINQAMFELYDLLVTSYEDYFLAPSVQFQTNGTQQFYDLPNGSNTFTSSTGTTFTPQPFYKLRGVDLGVNTSNNAWVTINKFNFMDRNRFVFPNTSSTIYGVFNMQYRLMGTQIEFIPTPSGQQTVRLWYVPRLAQLLQDNSMTTIGFSGWLQYVIIRAAKYALDKEESDTSKLDEELGYLKGRIEEAAQGRDAGQPDRITDVRQSGAWGDGMGGGWNGSIGGF